MTKKALITGITGQDGSYMAELLLSKGYEVNGLVRQPVVEEQDPKMWRIRHILKDIHLFSGSLESYASIFRIMNKTKPDECYHFAAQSYVSFSFEDEFSTLNTNINGTLYLLSVINELIPECRFYFAGTSEMFGNAVESPQDENTPFYPRTPYGISKLAGFHLTKNYRQSRHLYAASGILFNHESPRRGAEYVTRKITSSVAKIKHGKLDKLKLGNLDARRDWGYAVDYVDAIWRMLNQENADDYVISTGESHSVKDFLEIAFSHVDMDWHEFVEVDQSLVRPPDALVLQGNPQKAHQELGWKPTISFEDIVTKMVDADLEREL